MSYYIPRNTKGEGRILFVFSPKGLIYTAVGVAIGAVFYFIFSSLNLKVLGFITIAILGLIGFAIGTLKVPDIKSFEFTKKTGGLNLDEVILTAIKFKKNKKIYIYDTKEETKDE